MSIRRFAAVTLVLAGLAACSTSNYGSTGTVSTGAGGGAAAATDADSGFHANSYGYGSRYFQLGRD